MNGPVRRPSEPPGRWSPALLFLLVAMFVGVTTEFLPTGLLEAISRDLEVPASTAGLLVTAYSFVVAITALPLAAATGRLPPRLSLALALAGYAVSNVVLALAPGFAVAALARLLGGLAHALFFAVVAGYVARIVPADRVGHAIATVWIGNALAFVVGVPAATLLGTGSGWRAAFLVIGAASALAAIAAPRVLPDVAGDDARGPLPLDLRREPALWVVSLTIVAVMAGQFTLHTYVAPFLVAHGVPAGGIGAVLFGYGLLGVVGTWVAGLLVDRRPRGALLAALLVLCAALITLGLVRGIGPAGVVAFAAWGLTFGSLSTFLNTAALRAAAERPALASATATAAFNLGIGLGALLGGVVLVESPPAVLPLVAAALVMGTAVLVATARRTAFPTLAR